MLALFGCLVNTDLYEQRLADLTDHDGDGFVQQDDCDDADADTFPGAEEHCDARDNDCDGAIDDDAADASTWYHDTDADSFGDAESEPRVDCLAPAGHVANALDCDDTDTTVNPGASELPYDDLDNDCADGDLVDADGDGHDALEAEGDDCDDTESAVNPSAAEIPYDGVDTIATMGTPTTSTATAPPASTPGARTATMATARCTRARRRPGPTG